MKVRLTVKNTSRTDYGKVYEYNSILDYLFDNRESFDEMLEEDGFSCLTDEQIKEVVNVVFDTDIKSDFDIDNSWKEQDLIDFDNPIVNGIDVAQSMYSAITDTCYYVVNNHC